jgi:hypothetical protein
LFVYKDNFRKNLRILTRFFFSTIVDLGAVATATLLVAGDKAIWGNG